MVIGRIGGDGGRHGHGDIHTDVEAIVRALAHLTRVLSLSDAGGMRENPSTEGGAARPLPVEASTIEPVAGKIKADPGELRKDIGDWIADMTARRRSARTVKQYSGQLSALVNAMGWTRRDDISPDDLTAYINAQPWAGATRNRALCTFRSFTHFLRKTRRIVEDPLTDMDRSPDDGEEGGRAATLEEARAIIAYARAREMGDGRCRGDRALYWLMLFSMGMRFTEPGLLQWHKHVYLEGEHPHILFSRDINKNRRLEEVPIPPELLGLLLEHRARMKALSATTPYAAFVNRKTKEETRRAVDPDDPEAFVFPWAPSRVTFRDDRDGAQIPAETRRGLGFSPRSARKFFTVEMTQRGVPEKMVDRMMRHKGKVEARYYKPSLKEMCEWAKKMPNLWPGNDFGKAKGVDNCGLDPFFTQVDLQTSQYTGTFIPVASSPVQQDCTRPPVPGVPPTMRHTFGPGVGRGSSAVVDAAAPGGAKDRRGSSQRDQSENRHSAIDNAGLIELAEILEATGRLLRRLGSGSGGVPQHHPDSRQVG